MCTNLLLSIKYVMKMSKQETAYFEKKNISLDKAGTNIFKSCYNKLS